MSTQKTACPTLECARQANELTLRVSHQNIIPQVADRYQPATLSDRQAAMIARRDLDFIFWRKMMETNNTS